MTKELKISFSEIVKVLGNHYKIKNIRFMRTGGYDPDMEICELPHYVIGEIQNEQKLEVDDMMKCKNCGEPIDKFIGEKTKAVAWLHVIKIDANNEIGYLWGWCEQSKEFCRNPEPESEGG